MHSKDELDIEICYREDVIEALVNLLTLLKEKDEIKRQDILEIKKKLDDLENKNISHCDSSQMKPYGLIVQVNPTRYYYFDYAYGQWREY